MRLVGICPAVLIFLGACGASGQQCDWKDSATVRIGEFAVRHTRGRSLGRSCLQVTRKNRVELKLSGGAQLELANGMEEGSPKIVPGSDITGLGKPNLVVTESTGGAHCCTVLHVLELGSSVREIAAVDLMDSENVHLIDLDGDGVWEMVGQDWTFSYWHTSFAESPAPEVVLRFDGQRYRLALDWMRRPAGYVDIRTIAERSRAHLRQFRVLPPVLWGGMLDAIYTGNGVGASDLIAAVWPMGGADKQKFVREFCDQLASSPWFEDLRPNLKGSPCEGREARPASRI